MGAVSAGGALLPYQDQELKGNLTVDGNVTVKGKITQSGGGGDTLISPTISGTVAGGATYTAPTFTAPVLGTPASGVATNLTGTAAGLTAGGLQQSGAAAVGYATGSGGTVTQITSSSTGVTLNKANGTVVTVALTTAHGAHEQFTVTNSKCAAVTDVIVLSTTYAGAGTPVLQAVNVTASSFDIVIYNADASAALNAAMTINFAILTAVAA